MIYELGTPTHEKVRGLFAGLNYHLVIFSIIEGNSPGQIWVDRLDQPQTAFVWDKVEGGFYLVGNENNDEFNAALNHCIRQNIYPATWNTYTMMRRCKVCAKTKDGQNY